MHYELFFFNLFLFFLDFLQMFLKKIGEKSSYDNTNANVKGINGLTIEDMAYDEKMVT